MKVHIYKLAEGAMSMLVDPGSHRVLAPILVQGVTGATVAEELLKVLEVVDRAPVRGQVVTQF